jgi:MYXO-CTERM domain-containing protein
VYYFAGSKNPMISLVKSTADHFKRCGHEVVWDVGSDLDHPGELQAIFAGPVAERVVAWLDTKRNTCLEPPASAPSETDAPAGGPAPDALLGTTENTIELTSNAAIETTAGHAEPAFAGGEPVSSGPVASKSGPVPGGCGCRPAVTASAGSAWLIVVAAGLLTTRRRPQA